MRSYTQQCLVWPCEVWRWCFLCRVAAQTGVLSRGADGPGDLHGEADPLSGQWHADSGVWELQQVHICYRWASVSLSVCLVEILRIWKYSPVCPFFFFPDTIRKMKNDFKKMEDEMDCLSANMAAITEFSASISGTLQDQHAQITKLSGET